MAKKDKKQEEGVDLSTAAEMWTEEELRAMIREEALKILLGQSQQGIQPMPNTIYPQVLPTYPQWTQTSEGNMNQYHDGHTHTCNAHAGELIGASC